MMLMMMWWWWWRWWWWWWWLAVANHWWTTHSGEVAKTRDVWRTSQTSRPQGLKAHSQKQKQPRRPQKPNRTIKQVKGENKSGSFRNWKCLRRQADLDITQKHLLWRKDWSFLLMCSDDCSLNVIAVTFLLTIYTVWGLPSGRISGNYFHLWQFVLLTGSICKKCGQCFSKELNRISYRHSCSFSKTFKYLSLLCCCSDWSNWVICFSRTDQCVSVLSMFV